MTFVLGAGGCAFFATRLDAGFFFGAVDRVAFFRFGVRGGDFFAPTRGTAFAERRLPSASFLETLSALGFLATGRPFRSCRNRPAQRYPASRRRPTAGCISGTPIPRSATRNLRAAAAASCCFGSKMSIRRAASANSKSRSSKTWRGSESAFAGAPRRQSEHLEDYAAALSRLRRRELVYPCFCTRGEILRNERRARSRRRAVASRRLYRRLRERNLGTPGRGGAGRPEARHGSRAGARSEAALLARIRRGRRRVAASRRSRRPGATSSCAARTGRRPTIWRWSSTTRCRASPTSYAGATSSPRHRSTGCCRSCWDSTPPRYRHHRLVLDATGAKMSKSASSRPLSCSARGGADALARCAARWASTASGAQRLQVALS